MRRLILALALAGACKHDSKPRREPAPAAVDAALSTRFAKTMAETIGTRARGATVDLVAHQLTLAVSVEKEVPVPDKGVVIGVKVTCAVDGAETPAFSSGAVGIDKTRDDALATAASEWANEFGRPIAAALAGGAATLRAGGFDVHGGPAGIRGSAPAGLADLDGAVFRALAPALPDLFPSPAGYHAIRLMVNRDAAGGVNGEFRVDGRISPGLEAQLKLMTWPEGHYLLKQFYVLVPTPTAAARPAAGP